MNRKKRKTVEFRFYEPPKKEPVLALLGESWIRVYGQDVTNPHFHNLMEIGYCRDGKGSLFYNGENVPYETGSVTVIPANYPHSTLSEGGKLNYWEYLFFDPAVILKKLYPDNPAYQKRLLGVMTKRALHFSEREQAAFSETVKLIMEEMREKPNYYIESVGGLMLSLCISILRFYRGETEIPELGKRELPRTERETIPIKAGLSYIMEHYMESIRAEDIARVCSMSETHLRRFFEEYVRMSPMDYLNFVRVQNACDILKKSSIPMEQVAMRVGFNTISTFNRNFKRFVGLPPYRWKRNPGNYENKLNEFKISPLRGW